MIPISYRPCGIIINILLQSTCIHQINAGIHQLVWFEIFCVALLLNVEMVFHFRCSVVLLGSQLLSQVLFMSILINLSNGPVIFIIYLFEEHFVVGVVLSGSLSTLSLGAWQGSFFYLIGRNELWMLLIGLFIDCFVN